MLQYLMAAVASIRSDEEGQTAVEYGLVLALIAVVLVVALAAGLGTVITGNLSDITDALA
jgi:pilus assembly protein Flp/PilA